MALPTPLSSSALQHLPLVTTDALPTSRPNVYISDSTAEAVHEASAAAEIGLSREEVRDRRVRALAGVLSVAVRLKLRDSDALSPTLVVERKDLLNAAQLMKGENANTFAAAALRGIKHLNSAARLDDLAFELQELLAPEFTSARCEARGDAIKIMLRGEPENHALANLRMLKTIGSNYVREVVRGLVSGRQNATLLIEHSGTSAAFAGIYASR